jgi:glycosyltransferase involved in cell wall biosynthesis
MKRILYDNHIFAYQKYGGISRYFYEISKRINQFPEFNVIISAPLYFNEYIRHNTEIVRGIYVPNIPKSSRVLRRLNTFLSGSVVTNFKPDIIHETYYHKNPISFKAPVVTTVYDMIHEKFRADFSRRDNTSQMKEIAVSRADHIICISENTKRDLMEILNTPAEKISVVYLGFSFDNKNPGVSYLAKPNRPYILYVGNRGEYKNFNRLLEAFASSRSLMKDFKLVAFGGGKFRQEERKNIRKLGLTENNITQISGSDELLKDFYCNATAFIYPSLYEGFGIPPLEAMSVNCPVICSNASSIPEVVGDAGEYFDPYDVDSIKTAVERVIESNSLQQNLICRGEKQRTKFSWDLCAEQTSQIYNQLRSS